MTGLTKEFKTKTNVPLTLLDTAALTKIDDSFVLTTSVKKVREEMIVERDFDIEEFLNLRNVGFKVEATRLDFFKTATIQKALAMGKIVVPAYAQGRMQQRGYTTKDLVSAIWSGKRTELQYHRGKFKAMIEGLDSYNNPICIVVTGKKFTKQLPDNKFVISDDNFLESPEGFLLREGLTVVSVFPPIKNKFTRHVLNYA